MSHDECEAFCLVWYRLVLRFCFSVSVAARGLWRLRTGQVVQPSYSLQDVGLERCGSQSFILFFRLAVLRTQKSLVSRLHTAQLFYIAEKRAACRPDPEDMSAFNLVLKSVVRYYSSQYLRLRAFRSFRIHIQYRFGGYCTT